MTDLMQQKWLNSEVQHWMNITECPIDTVKILSQQCLPFGGTSNKFYFLNIHSLICMYLITHRESRIEDIHPLRYSIDKFYDAFIEIADGDLVDKMLRHEAEIFALKLR